MNVSKSPATKLGPLNRGSWLIRAPESFSRISSLGLGIQSHSLRFDAGTVSICLR